MTGLSGEKEKFLSLLTLLANDLTQYVSTECGDWAIKGFIDTKSQIYSITSDTKIVSKILEVQLFPKIKLFAEENGYHLVLADKQNWYPDMSFVSKENPDIKFAVDIKTTYRLTTHENFCNGFTLGSHGEYFRNRASEKNVQFPYGSYLAHISLGILYTRTAQFDIDETRTHTINDLLSIKSVISDFLFFVQEKWKIASERSGSGNTANIGSIDYIPDLLAGNGSFSVLGETVFDEYWINHGQLNVPNLKKLGEFKKLSNLEEFLDFKGLDHSGKVKRQSRAKVRGT
jgi:Restriction endonuclease EcoRV